MGKSHSKQVIVDDGDCIVFNTHVDGVSTVGEEGIVVSSDKPATPKKGHQSAPLRVVLPVQTTESGSKMFVTGTVDTRGSESEAATTDNNGDSNKAFECDISALKGAQKQEWSFTLYDFDGHGKVTKDDLAQLLKSLYDSVGSSIQLPHKGTKTVKLRLTVSPDRTAETPPSTQNSSTDIGAKQNNIATAAAQARKRSQVVDMTNNLSEKYSSPAAKTCEKAGLKTRNREVKKEEVVGGEDGGRQASDVVASLDQRHLVQLVKRNMERHQQRTRRHASRRQHSESTCQPPVASSRTVQHGENVDRRNYYLDLAGVENTTPTALTERTPHAPAACTAQMPHGNSQTPAGTRRLHEASRSRTHADLPSPSRRETGRTRRVHQSSSPRHRQANEEQRRAMQQVAEWIEKEHSQQQQHHHYRHDDVMHHEHHHVHEHHHHHHYHHYHPPA